jgi:putative hydrolase of the HAD superfamily
MNGADIDIIIFDAGGTLLYPDPPVGEVYARAGLSHGIEADPAEMEQVFWQTFREMPSGATAQTPDWWREMVRRVFSHFGEPEDLDGLRLELDAYFQNAEAFRLFPGAREAVMTLRYRGYRTGLISNWEKQLRGILLGLDLLPMLDPAIISAEIGAEKPDSVIFQTALDAAGVAPERAVMVGDTPEADGRGAVAMGMHAVLIGEMETDLPRTRSIKKIADLPNLFPERR